MASYLSSKVKKIKSKIEGDGLFATGKISRGELVINYKGGVGRIVDKKTAESLWKKGIDYDLQIDDDSFFVATSDKEKEDADFLNHSCDPNCGINGRFKIVAMRDIALGEEITFDYAMSESYDYKMKCNCGSKNCRMTITGNDWKLKELQERHKGHFSSYLERRIKKSA